MTMFPPPPHQAIGEDDSPITFWGEVPRRGDRIVLVRGKEQIHAKVTDVEWRILDEEAPCATIYYETTERQTRG